MNTCRWTDGKSWLATINVGNKLVCVYLRQGRSGDAAMLLESCLEEAKRNDRLLYHPATLSLMHNLAVLYREQRGLGLATSLEEYLQASMESNQNDVGV